MGCQENRPGMKRRFCEAEARRTQPHQSPRGEENGQPIPQGSTAKMLAPSYCNKLTPYLSLFPGPSLEQRPCFATPAVLPPSPSTSQKAAKWSTKTRKEKPGTLAKLVETPHSPPPHLSLRIGCPPVSQAFPRSRAQGFLLLLLPRRRGTFLPRSQL